MRTLFDPGTWTHCLASMLRVRSGRGGRESPRYSEWVRAIPPVGVRGTRSGSPRYCEWVAKGPEARGGRASSGSPRWSERSEPAEEEALHPERRLVVEFIDGYGISWTRSILAPSPTVQLHTTAFVPSSRATVPTEGPVSKVTTAFGTKANP